MIQATHAPEVEERAAPAVVASPRDAAATLYDLYRQRIREYCVGQLRDRQEADDAVQSTFLYAFTLLQRGITPKTPLPWLYTIAHNVCRTRRRAIKRRGRLESGVDLETIHESVGRNDPPREELANLTVFLNALPANQRNALLLREWHGLAYGEIAAYLGLTESAVETLLFRARRNLAQKLQRTAERVASFAGVTLLVRGARRFTEASSATAAAVAIGAAAVTTLAPLGPAAPATPERAQPAAAAAAVVPDARSIDRAPAGRATPLAPRSHSGGSAPPAQTSSTSSTPVSSQDDASVATVDVATPAPPTRTATVTSDDAAVAGPGAVSTPRPPPALQPVADAVHSVVKDVQSAVTEVTAAVTTTEVAVPTVSDVAGAVAPTVDNVVATVTTIVPPTLPFPPHSAPLQGKP